MTNSDLLTNANEAKQKLIESNMTMDDLRSYINLKFPSLREAGYKAGLSKNRVQQILIGYSLPKSAKLIYQIAKAWELDPVKLTLLFENERSALKDSVPDFIPAGDYTSEKIGEEAEVLTSASYSLNEVRNERT